MTRDLAASVRARLANKAKETNRPFQEVLTYFAMERFLYRLSRTEHTQRFILKGALMFTAWGTSQTRATRDIDFLAHAANSVEAMTDVVRSICAQEVPPDGMVFLPETARGAAIKEDADYSGVRVTFTAKLQNARILMQTDIGFGDVIYPGVVPTEYPTMLEFEGPHLLGYPKETVVAEKFEALTKLGQLNSRMKDYSDILTLSRQFDFDGSELATAIQATFANRRTEVRSEPVGLSEAFSRDPTKQTQWAAFLRKSKLTGVPTDLTTVVEELRSFLAPIAIAILQRKAFELTWKEPGPWRRSEADNDGD
ncbi:nucleotidyl transferase AbiEii/AbiGii toxin family protein [Candidatus Laterigemmans baculatus]|uniref:nucleotidyl transferase AbiEii/AbiGii toxin family protein n=1 Tax=Candidatus Laterigemmans baculatus TaxID=2770505 RepID=UPI00193B03FC|nr:nucleotidyl transferase AbiEii/AbiGii toxin family protein [Candidatus Laterigemmans baculatus]